MIAKIGMSFRKRISDTLYALGFAFRVFASIPGFFKGSRLGKKVLSFQILFTGVEALGVIALLSLGLGTIIIIQGLSLLPQFGQGQLIYQILIIVIMRELGPVLTAFIITARSGTAIATELGNMVIQHEIEAYMASGINPFSYLIVPRLFGVTLSLIILNIYFNVFGLAGSYFITQIFVPMPIDEYFNNLLAAMSAQDIIASSVKSVIFGIIIALSASFAGLKVKTSSTEIPGSAIKAVGNGFVLCILADAAITILYYLG